MDEGKEQECQQDQENHSKSLIESLESSQQTNRNYWILKRNQNCIQEKDILVTQPSIREEQIVLSVPDEEIVDSQKSKVILKDQFVQPGIINKQKVQATFTEDTNKL